MNKSEFREFRRNAQIIHQDPYETLNPMRTIYQSLSPPLLHYRIARNRKEAWEKSAELLELVGLVPPDDFGVARYLAKGGRIMVRYLGSMVEIIPAENVILEPLHPYTKVSIASLPVPNPKLARSMGIPSLKSLDVPSLTEVPSGCKFHPRCPHSE